MDDIKELIIDNHIYDVNNLVGAGGEGEIYELNDDYVAKVYYENIRNADRKQKVLALCNSFSNNIGQFGEDSFAFPQHPAYQNRIDFDSISGFSMHFFKEFPEISPMCYDLNSDEFRKSNNYQFKNENAIEFIYEIFSLTVRLHKARIVLGDVNLGNILCDLKSQKPMPVFIDLDSAQIGQFNCITHSDDFLDPLIRQHGVGANDCYRYSSESDLFSLACLCFYLFVGANPFSFRMRPNAGVVENKQNGISSIKCYVKGTDFLSDLGITYLTHGDNKKIEERLKVLEKLDKRLFDFFVSIFIENNRTNLVSSLPTNDSRNPCYIFFNETKLQETINEIKHRRVIQLLLTKQKNLTSHATKTNFISDSGIDKIISTKHKQSQSMIQTDIMEDPPGFALFLNNYGINFSSLTGIN